MEQLLEVNNLEEALSGSLEIIVRELNSEGGAIWLLDKKTDRLAPVFHIGPEDISNVSIENGIGIEGIVAKTGRSMLVSDAASDPRFDGTVFDDYGIQTRTMICVPLNNVNDVIGCYLIVNKKDGSRYEKDELELCEHIAALAAMNRAPGSLRAHFGFMSIKGYKLMIEGEKSPRIAPRQRFGATPEQIWKEMLLEAQEQEKTEGLPPIIATDISPEAIENAKTNAYIAGVSKYIQFKACDFGDTPIPPSQTSEPFVSFSITGKEGYKARGCVFFNPEYGIRLGDPAELAPIYERIGTFMNEKCPGYTGGVLTGSPELSKMINLFYVTRIPFYNGPIDCRLFVFPGCELKGADLSTELSPSVDK